MKKFVTLFVLGISILCLSSCASMVNPCGLTHTEKIKKQQPTPTEAIVTESVTE